MGNMVVDLNEVLAWLGWATTAIVGGVQIYNRYQSKQTKQKNMEVTTMANGNNPRPQTKGKGGNINTTRNPFLTKTSSGSAPRLSGVVSLAGVLDKILECECAILLGNTRDGGALCITVLDGQERHRTYCSSEEELDEAFHALDEAFTKA